jgi:flavin reductase (DIM6/NTAB) family NADH-FMN oxidoreductase RutF
MQGEPVTEVAGGLPCLSAAVAWLACSVRSFSDGGDPGPGGRTGVGTSGASHTLVIGEVIAAGATDRLGGPSEDDAVLSMTDTRMSYGG